MIMKRLTPWASASTVNPTTIWPMLTIGNAYPCCVLDEEAIELLGHSAEYWLSAAQASAHAPHTSKFHPLHNEISRWTLRGQVIVV